MLTKEDLQEIGKLFEDLFDHKFEEKFNPIRKDIKKIQKTLDATIRLFDNDVDSLNKRVTRVEDHLKLPPIN